MFDIAKIYVKAGNGGNGCISFRREKYIPRGGPDGGDGGHGGNILVRADSSLNTLLHLDYHTTWIGKRGAHGRSARKRGANAEDVVISVPRGTVVWRLDNGEKELVVDIFGDEQVIVAHGGQGGLGNSRFSTATQQEPVLAEKGGQGEKTILLMELKLLADVGIVGQPNAGKSTLLSTCSAARPKIAPYPFTTTGPVLGVVDTRGETFVMMEVPGLIEGAHTGKGLGHEFLRHAERSRLLLHIVDGMSPDPVADLQLVDNELASFGHDLGSKPQMIIVNKLDIPEVKDRINEYSDAFAETGRPLFFVSAATGEGVDALMGKALETLKALPVPPVELRVPVEVAATPRRRSDDSFSIRRENGVYVLDVPSVERLVPMANLRDQRAMIQIWKLLQRIGVVEELEAQGVEEGDTVRLGGVDLEWY